MDKSLSVKIVEKESNQTTKMKIRSFVNKRTTYGLKFLNVFINIIKNFLPI